MISVLILTFNEEVNIARCLDSVAWSDDVLVVDSFSADRTVEIAKSRGVRVLQNRFVNFADQRNFGLDHGGFKHDWVLHLDADEVIGLELKEEIFSVVEREAQFLRLACAQPGGAPGKKSFPPSRGNLATIRLGEGETAGSDAYRLASKVIFRGRWLKHSGLYPWYQVRFGRRDRLRFVQVGHGQRENLPAERLGTLRQPLLHYSFSKGMYDWIERHNRYSTAEAIHYSAGSGTKSIDWSGVFSVSDGARRRRALKQLFASLPFRPTLRFIYMYVFRLGFLDGRAGFTYCRLLRIYEYFTVLKIREHRRIQSDLPL